MRDAKLTQIYEGTNQIKPHGGRRRVDEISLFRVSNSGFGITFLPPSVGRPAGRPTNSELRGTDL